MGIKHLLMLGCFQVVEMTKGEFCRFRRLPECADVDAAGYRLKDVATGEVHWQTKEQVDRRSTALPVDFEDMPVADRVWVAERAMHAQRIIDLEKQLAERRPHYEANGTTDVFAQNFIEPHLERLRVIVEQLDEAIRCID